MISKDFELRHQAYLESKIILYINIITIIFHKLNTDP